jgi:hypothetical protein
MAYLNLFDHTPALNVPSSRIVKDAGNSEMSKLEFAAHGLQLF